jgi:hypothetical protein
MGAMVLPVLQVRVLWTFLEVIISLQKNVVVDVLCCATCIGLVNTMNVVVVRVINYNFLKVLLLCCCYFNFIVHSYFTPCPADVCNNNHEGNDYNDNNNTKTDIVAYCPMNNTCCRTYNPISNDYIQSCIPNDLGSYNGTCCTDDFESNEYYNTDDDDDNNNDIISSTTTITTGCAIGYTCMKDMGGKFCQQSTVTDPLVSVLPRYQLCNQQQLNYGTNNKNNNTKSAPIMYGWKMIVPTLMKDENNDNEEKDFLLLPYYSTHGNIQSIIYENKNNKINNINDRKTSRNRLQTSTIHTAVIVIHGAGRNADDYYCSMLAARELFIRKRGSNNIKTGNKNDDDDDERNNILIIVPRFPLTTDNDTYVSVIDSNGINDILQWDGTGTSSDDISGTWRYGADAVISVTTNTTTTTTTKLVSIKISSYDCIDSMINTILNNIPSIKTVSIMGHSSGGQFVQRWSFLTDIWDSTRMKGVVVNPSSYLYFTNRRLRQSKDQQQFMADNGILVDNAVDVNNGIKYGLSEWYTPNISDCPNYNKWHYGLDFDNCAYDNNTDIDALSCTSNTYRVRYVQQNVQNKYNNNKQYLINRYLYTRTILYLIGQDDQCNISQYDTSSWCYSHGLETTCPNLLQGITRYDRHWHYLISLLQLVNEYNHHQEKSSMNISTNNASTSTIDNTINDATSSADTTKSSEQLQDRSQLFQHIRRTVPHVGHDHNLIMTSQIGLASIFDPIMSSSLPFQESTTETKIS